MKFPRNPKSNPTSTPLEERGVIDTSTHGARGTTLRVCSRSSSTSTTTFLGSGALWPMPAWVWRDVRSVFFFFFFPACRSDVSLLASTSGRTPPQSHQAPAGIGHSLPDGRSGDDVPGITSKGSLCAWGMLAGGPHSQAGRIRARTARVRDHFRWLQHTLCRPALPPATV